MRIFAISGYEAYQNKAVNNPTGFYQSIPLMKQDGVYFSGIKTPSTDEVLKALKTEPINVVEARNKFHEVFGQRAEVAAFAPGRVEFIGNHVDNYGGHVIGFPTDSGVLALASESNSGVPDKRLVTIYSEKFTKENGAEFGTYTFDLNEDIGEPEKYYVENFGEGGAKENWFWAKNAESTIRTLNEQFNGRLDSMNILDVSNLPCTGISTSAAAEVSVANAVLALHCLRVDPERIALLCKKAENLAGMSCGILDQGTIAMAKGKDTGVLIDCQKEPIFNDIPLDIEGHKLVFIVSGANHANEKGVYNKFREGYNIGTKVLLTNFFPELVEDSSDPDITRLGQIKPEQFKAVKEEFEKVVAEYNRTAEENEKADVKKVEHGVYENKRVMDAVEALKQKDIKKLGELLNESHYSSRDNLRVSCDELDKIHEIAMDSGAVGGRLSGAGWGGGAFFIVPDEELPRFVNAMETKYRTPKGKGRDGGEVPRMFIFEAKGGARVLDKSVKEV